MLPHSGDMCVPHCPVCSAPPNPVPPQKEVGTKGPLRVANMALGASHFISCLTSKAALWLPVRVGDGTHSPWQCSFVWEVASLWPAGCPEEALGNAARVGQEHCWRSPAS